MRRMRWFGVLVVGGFLLGACGGLQSGVPEFEVAEVAVANAGEDGQVRLMAGQHLEVGVVTVTNDAEEVCVTYALNEGALADGWLLFETHLFVGAKDDFPLTRANARLGGPYFANPIPGRFPFGDDALGGVEEWQHCVALDDLGVELGEEVFVAAHAVIGGAGRETAWGEGSRLNQRGNWGMWFTYTLAFELFELTMEVIGCGSVVGSGVYAAGSVVPISALADPGVCSAFESWSASAGDFGDALAAQTTFTMPAEDVTVTAEFSLEWSFERTPSSYVDISNVSLGEASGGVRPVRFDISWPESWRGPDRPSWVAADGNWDAAWVFVKYRECGGAWQHASLAGGGHVVPVGVVVDVPSDGVGAFIYRSSPGYGALAANGVGLQWAFEDDGVSVGAGVEVVPFGIEMVYVPQGSFWVGSGGTSVGEFREGGTEDQPFLVSSQSSISLGDGSGQLMWTEGGASGSPSGSTSASFPTGYEAFYVMKYQVTQGQYVDFLNTLTQAQANARKHTGSDHRYAITGDSVGSYATSLPFVALNYVSWNDGAAFADWAGLRPLTELEFEKAARGPTAPVADEFAWGSTSITPATGLANEGTIAEVPTPEEANANYTAEPFPIPRLMDGPVRVGSFAAPDRTREVAGAGYYGALELSGNLYERLVTVGNEQGQAFTGAHGDGTLHAGGTSTVPSWPGSDAVGSGWRGGGFIHDVTSLRVSTRHVAAYVPFALRTAPNGWRSARSAQ